MNRWPTGHYFGSEAASDFFGVLRSRLSEAGSRWFPSESKMAPSGVINRLLQSFVRWLDALLRRYQGINQFTNDEQCVLRLSIRQARAGGVLPGGPRSAEDQWIGEIHLWNEHIPPMPPGGADMIWGTIMRRRLHLSLVSLAEFVQSDARFSHVKAFCGEMAFPTGKSLNQTRRMASCFGFEVTENHHSPGFWARLGKAIYLWGMARTFNPGAIKPQSLMKPVWFQFSLRRDVLLKKYSAPRVTQTELIPPREMAGPAASRAN